MRSLIVALLLVFPASVGCGDGDTDSMSAAESQPDATTAAEPAPAEAKPAAKKGTKVILGESRFGKILFDSKRQAIYLFDKESTGGKPACYGACAEAWPPVFANGKPRLGKGLDRALLGTVRRRNGRKQVTYGGHPLYYYAHEGPGQVLCHDIDEFGGLWLVVKKNGDPVPSSR